MATPDLYAVLGLSRDATRADVRKAYRSRAKRAHPDVGGDTRKFALIKTAADTLGDDKRRAAYDRTGEVEDNPVDNHAAAVMAMISATLGFVLQECDKIGMRYERVDLVQRLEAHLRNHARELRERNAAVQPHLANLRKIARRFRAKTSGERNYLEEIVNGQIAALTNNVEGAKRQLETIEEAARIVSGHVFECEQAPDWRTQGRQSPLMGFLSTGRMT